MTGSKKQKATARAAAEATPSDTEGPASAPETPEQDTPPAPGAAPAAEMDQLKERLLRLQADFDNYRKRMARERQETIALANADLLSELLTPLDHMDRAIEAMARSAGEDDACVQGIRLVRTELMGTLDRFGLQRMQPCGQPFDPSRHEALGWAQASGVDNGQIAAELRAGYLLNGRVLRAAQVLLAGKAPDVEPAAETDAGPDVHKEG